MTKQISILTLSVILIAVFGIFFSSCKKDEVDPPAKVATSIELISGNNQTAIVETALANPVVVIVKDQNGDAFAGTDVSFTVSEGSVSASTVTTDANGNASVTWTLGGTVGEQTLTATATGLTDKPIFSATGNQITVTDYDGNIYNAVTIGTQVWMAEDLKVTHYPNGDAIPHVTDNTAWGDLAGDNTSDAYCFYDNDNTTDYGALYTYAAAIGDDWARDNTADQGVCPDGWHLPTDAEWTELTDYLGGGSVAGEKLKEAGNAHWESPNIATNESGFTALPGSYRNFTNGTFGLRGYTGWFWSATEDDAANAWYRRLSNDFSDVTRDNGIKNYGLSVRCLRD